MPNKLPDWSVQQAFPIEKYPPAPGAWFALTQKLNGVRATYYRGKMIGRNGTEFSGLHHIVNELYSALIADELLLDGELIWRGPGFGSMDDNERFRMTTGILNAKDDGPKHDLVFVVFDVITEQDFFQGVASSDLPYRDRRAFLDIMASTWGDKFTAVEFLPTLYTGTDQRMIYTMLDRMVAEGNEGLMVNLDVPYQRKRHRGILKVKRFYTMDLPIVTAIEGKGRLKGTLGSVEVMFRNNLVGVGTGFSDEQRAVLWDRRYELPGILAEIKYKEVSYDKSTGLPSLQFPVFVSLREDKTEPSEG